MIPYNTLISLVLVLVVLKYIALAIDIPIFINPFSHDILYNVEWLNYNLHNQ